MSSAAHPNGRSSLTAKVAAGLCFAIAAGLMIASLMYPSPARAAQKVAAGTAPLVAQR
jgi:hypothetical protein